MREPLHANLNLFYGGSDGQSRKSNSSHFWRNLDHDRGTYSTRAVFIQQPLLGRRSHDCHWPGVFWRGRGRRAHVQRAGHPWRHPDGLGLVQVVEIAFPSLDAGIYGWALVVAAVGLGMAIFGRLLGSPDLERGGWGVARAGLVFFLVVGILIELFATFTGVSSGPRSLIWPVVLILTGVVTLALRMFRLAQDGELLGGAGSFEREKILAPACRAGSGDRTARARR
jgi:hypothetical protein